MLSSCRNQIKKGEKQMNKKVIIGLIIFLITVIALIGIPQALAFRGHVTDPPIKAGSRIDGSVSGRCPVVMFVDVRRECPWCLISSDPGSGRIRIQMPE